MEWVLFLFFSKQWPERNEVFLVGKCDYTSTVILWHWKKILEDIRYLCEHNQLTVRTNTQEKWILIFTVKCPLLTYPFAQPWGEVVKNKVGIGLRHGAYIWNIVPHYHIVKCKICCWSKWKVAHHQAICGFTWRGVGGDKRFSTDCSLLFVKVWLHVESHILPWFQSPNYFNWLL